MGMYHNHSSEDSAIPNEYRTIAKALLPSSPEQGADPAAATDFAEALGIGTEYRRLMGIEHNTEQMRKFLGHFQNNLDLLIQKTWVEKADESRKEKLQDEVLPLMHLIVQGDFRQALEQFGAILEELSYLFFGAQSTKDDFTEYTFRIDDRIGLFWWYGSKLSRLKKSGMDNTPEESLWAVLLIGICYLTNF